LVSGAGSDRLIAVAWAIGLGAIGLTVALGLQVLVMRGRMLRRERRRDAFIATWRPLLFEYVYGGKPALPRLARRDAETFLLLWNQLQDGVKGEARARLARLADAVGAHATARRFLARRDALGRLLALRTLGHLGRAADRAEVVRHLDDRRAYLCLAAARALVHIDPGGAPAEILSRLAAREDWPVSLFATVLGESAVEPLSASFRALEPALSGAGLVRLMPLASILDARTVEEICERLLASSDDPDVVAAALRSAQSARLRPHVQKACAHEDWPVRTQAAAALGRLGEAGDRDLLVRLLRDPQWWVRYRAAQALISGRFGPDAEIVALAAGLHDRFARDIVAHALAERPG
jgi:HEAT repeat protein